MVEDAKTLFERVQKFEWDEQKRRTNIAKHGIDFLDAQETFKDPFAFTYLSPKNTTEQRYVTIGLMNGRLVAVVSTLRNSTLRVISARAARRTERQMYG